MERLISLSSQPHEREVQRYGLTLMGWATLSILVVAAPVLVEALRDPAGEEHRPMPDYLTTLRAGLGFVALLMSARLPALIRRHRTAIATVVGSRQQFRNAGTMTIIVGVLWVVFWWWIGLAVGAVGVLARLMVWRVPPLPPEQMTGVVEHPTWWKPES